MVRYRFLFQFSELFRIRLAECSCSYIDTDGTSPKSALSWDSIWLFRVAL